jgi:polyisoprenoid-binding protein YceI
MEWTCGNCEFTHSLKASSAFGANFPPLSVFIPVSRGRLLPSATMTRRFMAKLALALAIVLSATLFAQPPKQIDTARSKIIVTAYKSGLFSFAAHDHVINVPISSGTVDEGARVVAFRVNSADLQVLDPNESEKNRAEIRKVMLGPKLMEADKYPGISFHSTSVTQTGANTANVKGVLELHGVRRDVSLVVHREGEHYIGSTKLKQTDYGMTPVTIAGGTVKVKDEVKIEFEVVTQ